MAIGIEKIGDIMRFIPGNIPKRMTFDISEDGEFYYTRLYYDFYEKTTPNIIHEGYIECKSKFQEDFDIAFCPKDTDTIWEITIPDEEESK